MKKLINLLIITFFSLNTYAQIKFEKGYFINNSDQKTECLIRNVDWNNTPSNFRYKLSEDTSTESQFITSIKEFGIYNKFKFIRVTVNIDRSSERTEHLRQGREPRFKEEQLFISVITEGKASLYLYEENNFTRFFYSKDDSKVEQLIYKEYLIEGSKIAKNNDYKMQLYDNLKCESMSLQDFKGLDYYQKQLESVFNNYNICHNSNSKSFTKTKKSIDYNLRLHVNRAAFAVARPSFNFRDSDFGKQIYFGLGVEVEYTLPFNKGKWTLIAEPTFKIFNAKIEKPLNTLEGGKLISKIDYKYLEIPLGIRHNMFLNDNSKIFINVAYILNLNLNSNISFERANGSELNSFDLVNSQCYALGIGYEYNNKYSLELRQLTTRDLIGAESSWASEIIAISVILGYNLF